MALIKCEECGNMVSDKAKACPNCGCPLEQENESGMACPECGQAVTRADSACPNCGYPINNQDTTSESTYSQSYYYEEEEVSKKSRGWVYALLIGVLILASVIGGYFYLHNSSSIEGNDSPADELAGISIPSGKYCIIVQSDNFGEFIAPNGGHICGVEMRSDHNPPEFKLTKTLTVLGHNTDRLFVSGEYLFADYSDYLNLQYNQELNYASISSKKQGGVTVYTIDFTDGQIDPQEPQLHNIDFPEDQYTLVYYVDGCGGFYGPGNKYICALKDKWHEGNFRFSKTVTIYGKPYDDIYVLQNKVWKSNFDPISDKYAKPGEKSKSLADATYKEEGDMILAHFPVNTAHPRYISGGQNSTTGSSVSNGSSSPSSSQWKITSVEQLKGKLEGTIWTCRPTGRMWYRLVFSSGKMRLYYAQPSSGKWLGGDDGHVYVYQIKEGNTNDTGEKYIGVAFGKSMEDILAWGTLAFYSDGEIYFDWLRGREGGKAECRDFNWE